MTTIHHFETDAATDWAMALSGATTKPVKRTRVTVFWEAAIGYIVPVGYQDETGFHYGEEAVE